MIKKTNTYVSELEPSVIEYEDDECFDFIDNQDIPFNHIIAKGVNFHFWHIYTEKYEEYDNEINNREWQYIEYANVVEQTKDYTILYTRLLTNDTETGEFQLECEFCYKIMHHHSIEYIKTKYRKENNMFNTIKKILINHYGFTEDKDYNCIDYDYDCNNIKYKKIKLTKKFNNSITIGEAKNIIDDADKYAKESVKALTNGKAYKGLCFTEDGAIGYIKIMYKMQWSD